MNAQSSLRSCQLPLQFNACTLMVLGLFPLIAALEDLKKARQLTVHERRQLPLYKRLRDEFLNMAVAGVEIDDAPQLLPRMLRLLAEARAATEAGRSVCQLIFEHNAGGTA